MSKAEGGGGGGLANILAQRSFMEFRVTIKIFQSPFAKYYIVAAPCEYLNLFYDSQTMKHFHCEVVPLDEYLSLIDE